MSPASRQAELGEVSEASRFASSIFEGANRDGSPSVPQNRLRISALQA